MSLIPLIGVIFCILVDAFLLYQTYYGKNVTSDTGVSATIMIAVTIVFIVFAAIA